AQARIILGSHMNIQAPPNLSLLVFPRLIEAGLNDWGGVSPVTPDHVNPEARWPHLAELAALTASAGKTLVERLAVYPSYVQNSPYWQDSALLTPLLHASDTDGYARVDPWSPGATVPITAEDLAL